MTDFFFLRCNATMAIDPAAVYGYEHFITTIRARLLTLGDDEEQVIVGRLYAWKVHQEQIVAAGELPADTILAQDQRMRSLCTALFNEELLAFKDDVLEAAELTAPPVHILVVRGVKINRGYRGHMLGAYLVSRIMDLYGGQETLAALFQQRLEVTGDGVRYVGQPQPGRDRYWQSVGFKPVPGSDWLVRNAGQPFSGLPKRLGG